MWVNVTIAASHDKSDVFLVNVEALASEGGQEETAIR
jgi:hypothetical protein